MNFIFFKNVEGNEGGVRPIVMIAFMQACVVTFNFVSRMKVGVFIISANPRG